MLLCRQWGTGECRNDEPVWCSDENQDPGIPGPHFSQFSLSIFFYNYCLKREERVLSDQKPLAFLLLFYSIQFSFFFFTPQKKGRRMTGQTTSVKKVKKDKQMFVKNKTKKRQIQAKRETLQQPLHDKMIVIIPCAYLSIINLPRMVKRQNKKNQIQHLVNHNDKTDE